MTWPVLASSLLAHACARFLRSGKNVAANLRFLLPENEN